MADPITIGAFVSGVLALAAETVSKTTFEQITKDAYEALKSKLFNLAGATTAALVEKPESQPRISALAEDIDALTDDEKAKLNALAETLAAKLKTDNAARRAIGAKIGLLDARIVKLKGLTVEGPETTGIEAGTVKTDAFELEDLTVKSGEPGKEKR
jgi:hypothetical protein